MTRPSTRASVPSTLCGILLCSAAAAAAQSVGGTLTIQPGSTISSQVSAGLNEAVNGTPTSATGPSGSAVEINSRALKLTSPAPASMQSEETTAEKEVGPAGSDLLRNSVRVPGRSTAPPAPAALKNTHSIAGEGAYYSSKSFPDSTKGNATISSPDAGTTSPLEWSPRLDFGFPDFQATSFLDPSLNASRPVLNPTLKSTGQATHPSVGSYAPTRIASRSGLKTHLEQSDLHKSIDQQVGLLGAH